MYGPSGPNRSAGLIPKKAAILSSFPDLECLPIPSVAGVEDDLPVRGANVDLAFTNQR